MAQIRIRRFLENQGPQTDQALHKVSGIVADSAISTGPRGFIRLLNRTGTLYETTAYFKNWGKYYLQEI